MADPPLKHDRDLQKFRDAYGIKDADWAEKVELESRIRAEVTIDDISHLAKPVSVPIAGYAVQAAAAGAGTYSGIRITPTTRGGVYVSSAITTVNALLFTEIGASVFTQVGVGAPIVLSDDDQPPTTLVEHGHLNAAPAGLVLTAAFGFQGSLPFYLVPFKQMYFISIAANTAITSYTQIQEIP